VGDTGVGTGTHSYPKDSMRWLGMKFKIIAGFPRLRCVSRHGTAARSDGICESLDSVSGKRPDWIASKKVINPVPGRRRPQPQLKDVPFVTTWRPTRTAGWRSGISLCREWHRRRS